MTQPTNPNSGILQRKKMRWERDFTQIPNQWIRDDRISFAARGILHWLQSHEPSFIVTLESIARANTTGVSAVRSAVNELEKFGYIKRYKRKEKGRYAGTYWHQLDPFEVSETPQSALPGLEPLKNKTPDQTACDFPTSEKPTSEKRMTIEDHLKEQLNLTNPQPYVGTRERETAPIADASDLSPPCTHPEGHAWHRGTCRHCARPRQVQIKYI